jgi:hypothetical protein
MELYQYQPALWDPKRRWHKDKAKVKDAWNAIRNVFKQQCPNLFFRGAFFWT